jgi:predicted DNA binding CopG/RHH family protein
LHDADMKRRDDQVTIRLVGTLRDALEREAAASGRGLSHLIRRILIDHAAERAAERGQIAA